jgi:tetratricopeptide (TPR) repeat protein
MMEDNLNRQTHVNERAIKKYTFGDYRGAIDEYSLAIEMDPNDSRMYFLRGCVKKKINDLHGALADFTKAIELNPDDVDYHILRGCVFLELGQKNEARASFGGAIRNANIFVA